MSNPLNIVALSLRPISPKLQQAIQIKAANIGILISPYEEVEESTQLVSKEKTFSYRWRTNKNLTTVDRSAMREIAVNYATDLAYIPSTFDSKNMRILAMDMDSTLINIECIDEIADFAGKKPEVSKITEATMRGEIKDFSESLRQRVALLKGVSVSVLESVYKERLRPNPGAMKLLRTANSLGLHTLLVSGGFTFFTDKLQEELGFTQAKANTLEIQNGLLTGNVLGDIVDDVGKAAHLDNACKIVGCSKLNTVTIGDGANDLLMMTGSGLSIAYRAKPVVKEKADVAFDYVDLDAALVLIT